MGFEGLAGLQTVVNLNPETPKLVTTIETALRENCLGRVAHGSKVYVEAPHKTLNPKVYSSGSCVFWLAVRLLPSSHQGCQEHRRWEDHTLLQLWTLPNQVLDKHGCRVFRGAFLPDKTLKS